MSAEIRNSDNRSELLKDMIKRLHDGEQFEAVKKEFGEVFEGIGADEIAAAEKKLMDAGEVSVEEVQRLCDVHSALVHGSVAEIHGSKKVDDILGHPAWLLKKENEHITKLVNDITSNMERLSKGEVQVLPTLTSELQELKKIDSHYAKKENLWFPLMERYGITAPPKVMWGVDDEIRAMIKEAISTFEEMLNSPRPDAHKRDLFMTQVRTANEKIIEMITKENEILIPMVSEVFNVHDWRTINEGLDEFNHSYVENVPSWKDEGAKKEEVAPGVSSGVITLPSGHFTADILSKVLNTLPIDITFVDKNDEVAYFSQSNERIFPRTTAIIGREVTNCHPPASVHVVTKILDEFKSNKRDMAEFYIHLGTAYVHIRYFAVRDEKGEYLGTVEVTQNIAPIQAISGDKRLLDE
ncbi:MAG: DUF438 domain-containing protein [Spirochaetia bacterium]|nr:DUF438 domain-containing protein [Spirochaetia bacterium]